MASKDRVDAIINVIEENVRVLTITIEGREDQIKELVNVIGEGNSQEGTEFTQHLEDEIRNVLDRERKIKKIRLKKEDLDE